VSKLREEIIKIRVDYHLRSKFADHEPAAYFRDFVRAPDKALEDTKEERPMS
jgi:hypothetical protein